MQSIDWSYIEHLRRVAFHGSPLTREQEKLCEQAIKVDAERYRKIGERLRNEYRASFFGVPK